ncbi:MAG: ABC transporter permease [Acidobacteria bacterium]|nr:ABC transporter permease [Acidobacteriota bacterium]
MRYVARSLVRQSGPVVLAVGVLALGLGVNTAVLAVAYGVLWRPLPYRDADRLITVALVYREDESVFGEVQRDQLDMWNRSLRTARVAGHNSRERVVRAAGRALVTEVATVAGDFFGVLGAPAMQGIVPRFANGDRRAVVSTSLARMLEHEAGGPALGQTLSVGDGRYDVAAVLPSDFGFPSTDVDVWIAPPVAPSDPGSYRLVGRLQDGATLAQARDDATRVFRETLAAGADSWSADVRPIDERLRGEVRPVLQVSMGAALLVLVVACANAATLLIGRSVLRKPEFAIRIALGSGLTRLIRAALVEGLAIAGAGLILGLAAAWAGLRAFAALAAGVVPRVDAVGIDLPVLLAGLLLTVAVGVVCGGASAAGALRRDGTALRAGAPATGSRATSRLRAALVAGQIATTIVLLTGAGLLVRTVDRLLDEDAGFEPRQALTVRLMLADTPFIEGGAHNAFVETLLERVRGLPGVQAAGVGSVLPPDDEPVAIQFLYEDRRGAASRREIVLSFGAVTRGYFAALGTRLRDGRRFEAADDFADVGPVMLSETAARFVYPDEEAVGRPLPYNIDALGIARRAPIVAVVDDLKFEGLAAPRAGSIYVPWQRVPTGVSHLVVRTTGDPLALAPAVRDLVRTLAPSLPVPEVRTLEDHIAGSIAERRLRVLPAAGFAALALTVAMVGLFGTLARAVAERRNELAVRAAVGASPGRLFRLVLGSAVAVTGAGLAAGLPAAAATGRSLAALLYGVSPFDPVTVATVVATVVLAALAASAIPARRAARLDPMAALRAE